KGNIEIPLLQDVIRNHKDYTDVSFLNVGSTPENFIDKIVAYGADIIAIIDTADMGLPAGQLRVIPVGENCLLDTTTSTHDISLKLFIRYLTLRLKAENSNAKVALIAIQPKNLELGSEVSEEVRDTCNKYFFRTFVKKFFATSF
ncbi:MAG: hydrogenase maturation protease, partial [Elusimicrobiota bacterium]|nr:hydrogenase maturation protease [Elusimicrobiota bacterium]